MRFAILVKATEAGEMPEEETLNEVLAYDEEFERGGALFGARRSAPRDRGRNHCELSG